MPAPKPLADVPRPATALGLAGVLPFLALAILTLAGGAHASFALSALLGYGAVILSFLGGIHWGLGIGRDRPSGGLLGIGVLPSLVGWAALLVGGKLGLGLLVLAFPLVLAVDLRLTRDSLAPAWFPRLRVVLTSAVVACLLVALAS